MHRIITLAKHGRIVFSDAEYLNGSLISRNGRPKPHNWKEVTQIGAVRCDHGRISERFNVQVLPRVTGPDVKQMNQVAWDEYKRITRIPKEQVMAARTNYEDAWDKFKKFVRKDPIVIMLGDREVYKWNWKLLGENRDAEIDAMDWIILKSLLIVEHQKHTSGELSSLVSFDSDPEMPNNESVHDALYDATSMAVYCINADKFYNKV